MTCERCNAESEGYDLFPYCEKCGRNFCDTCWEKIRARPDPVRCPEGGDCYEEPSEPEDN